MRIGILGGTFDPIHSGHLLIAEQAKQQVDLDQVWFVPAGAPPHKTDQRVTPVDHRANMVQLAIADHPFFHLSKIEIDRPGFSYTIDTINLFVKTYPTDEFYLIVGADTVKDMPNWHKIKEIIKLVKIIGIHRPKVQLDHLPQWMDERLIWIKEEVGIYVSSSYIRQHITNRCLLQYVLPSDIYQYIEENQLYAD